MTDRDVRTCKVTGLSLPNMTSLYVKQNRGERGAVGTRSISGYLTVYAADALSVRETQARRSRYKRRTPGKDLKFPMMKCFWGLRLSSIKRTSTV